MATSPKRSSIARSAASPSNPPPPRSPDHPAAKRAGVSRQPSGTFAGLGNGSNHAAAAGGSSLATSREADESAPSTPASTSALGDSDDDDESPPSSRTSSSSSSNLLKVPSSPNAPVKDTGGFRFTVSRTPTESKDTEATELQVTVRITGTEKKKDHAKDKLHINYILKVATGLPGMNWSVARRYQAFAGLHAKLLSFVPKSKLPSLPGKSVTRSFKAQYIESKRSALEAYLGQLSLIADVRNSDHFCSFLVGSFEDIFDRSVSHQAIYKKGMAELKSAQDETSVAEAALETEKKETTLLRAKLAKQTADIQLVASLRTERDETKVMLTKVRDDEEKLRVMITPLEAKVRELSAATEALTIERNALLDSSDMLKGEIKNLKTEKKLLVKEVKSQRAQQAEQLAAADAAAASYNALLARCEQLTAALAASQHTTYMAQQQAVALQNAVGVATANGMYVQQQQQQPMAQQQQLPPLSQPMARTISNGNGVAITTIVDDTLDSPGHGGRPISGTIVAMSPVLAGSASPPFQPMSPPHGVAMMTIQTTPGMSPISVPMASPSPLASSHSMNMILPSPVAADYRIRPSVSGRPAAGGNNDDLINVENRAPSESIAQLFADFPQRGPAASVAQFDVLAQPRGPAGAPPSSRPPPPANTAPDPLLAQFYGNAAGQPPPQPASSSGGGGGGMQPSYSGQFGRTSVASSPVAANGPTAAKKPAAPSNSNASVLGMLKSKLMS